jgi:hypothetical protein
MRRFVKGRGRSPALLALVLALFLALSGLSHAATTHDLIVGQLNKASKGTTLRSKGGPTLTLANTGGRPAARFNVLKGKPPFAVSSRVKVIGLNADLLDGLDSSAFQARVTGGCAVGSAIRVINANGSVVCVSTLSPSPPPSWGLTGNAGTNPGTNFLGTTDAQPLVIRTNNAEALRITTNANLGVGTTTPRARIDANGANETAVNGTSSTAPAITGVANGTVAEPGVSGTSSIGDGVDGTSNLSNAGVLGKSGNGVGVEGESTNGAGAAVGVLGLSGTQPGVLGTSSSGAGVNGGSSSGAGVNGSSSTGDGVDGTSSGAVGVSGTSNSPTTDGVLGQASGGSGVAGSATTGPGVFGVSHSGDGAIGNSTDANGVGGASTNGVGVSGVSTNNTGVKGNSANDGVLGISSHPSGGGTAAAVDAINTGGGDIFIAQTSPSVHVARIDSTGKGFFDGGTQNSGADYAESVPASDASSLAPGDVLAIDPRNANQVTLAGSPDSGLVAGVYSTKPSVLAVGDRGVDASLSGTAPVAMLGIVPTKVSAENGAIRPGDLLTTAGTPGYAMKARPVVVGGVAIYPTGTILGKALAPLATGRGTIEVLLMMR